MRHIIIPLAVCAAFTIGSCVSEHAAAEKPIVLGDPATIVTETDSQYLKDFVVDMKPAAKTEPIVTDTAAATPPPADTAAADKKPEPEEKPVAKEEPAAEAPKGNGLTIAFKDVSFFIPDIKTRSYNKRDIANASGASYELTGGTLNGKQIKVTGGKVQRISQRTQTVVVAKNNLGTLMLESLSSTSGWAALKGSNNAYTVSGLAAGQLPKPKVTPATIRNAVAKAARSQRMKKAEEQKWLGALKNVRSADQKPLHVSLRTVTWKIDGKDAKGKTYQKQIRMDVPVL